MASPNRQIWVYAHWEVFEEPVLIGILTSERLRGKEVFSFEYEPSWLINKHVQILDPDLELYSGPQYLRDEKSNFGLFTDSSPDRWGRLLMRRREAALARAEGRAENTLFETDYLLGVHDMGRMGALRFKTDPKGSFLNNHNDFISPPWVKLRELELASLKIEDQDATDDPEYLQWLALLVAPGSSLGGARPKANVVDKQGHPWIAKFPSKNDHSDVAAWEMLTYLLATESGIKMAPSKLEKYTGKHHTFLTQRFDRTSEGKRVHFASALTLLGYSDGQDYAQGASYLELVDFIETSGANVAQDLTELWKRIVFSICVKNVDDHLRNHGFILTPAGWRLSPAYDINPDENGTGLKLNISENDNALDLALAIEVAPYFRLKNTDANDILKRIKSTVAEWRHLAKSLGISKFEQEQKARAFELVLQP